MAKVVLTSCYETLCDDAEVTGVALIKMCAPPGYDGPIYDTITSGKYPRNYIVEAPIEDGCWKSCPLPFSDQTMPNVTYEVVELIYGDGSCNDTCGCENAQCGCLSECPSDTPCRIWLSSTAGHPTAEEECLTVTPDMCIGFEDPGMPDGACTPRHLGIEFGMQCLGDEDQVHPVWCAPNDGEVVLHFVTVPVEDACELACDIKLQVEDDLCNVLCDNITLVAGHIGDEISCRFPVKQGECFTLNLASEIFCEPPSSIWVQGEFIGCADYVPPVTTPSTCDCPKSVGFELSMTCPGDAEGSAKSLPYFATTDSIINGGVVAYPASEGPFSVPIVYNFVNSLGVVLCSGIIPAGQTNTPSNCSFNLPAGDSVCLEIPNLPDGIDISCIWAQAECVGAE